MSGDSKPVLILPDIFNKRRVTGELMGIGENVETLEKVQFSPSKQTKKASGNVAIASSVIQL